MSISVCLLLDWSDNDTTFYHKSVTNQITIDCATEKTALAFNHCDAVLKCLEQRLCSHLKTVK